MTAREWIERTRLSLQSDKRPDWSCMPAGFYNKYVPEENMLAFTASEHLCWFLLLVCEAESTAQKETK